MGALGMKAIDRYLEERDAVDELLELLARGIREAQEARRSRLTVVREDSDGEE
jgi:hypothetical protein